MSIIITNVSGHDGGKEISRYVVRINNGPVIAQFEHWRPDGLATCLRLAADAVDRADLQDKNRRSDQLNPPPPPSWAPAMRQSRA